MCHKLINTNFQEWNVTSRHIIVVPGKWCHLHVPIICELIWQVFRSNTWHDEGLMSPAYHHKDIWAVEWDFQQCGMCDQQSLRSVCAYAQTDQSICLSLEYSVSVKLLTEHHLEFLSLKGGCTGSSESTLVKMPQCLKSRVMDHIVFVVFFSLSPRWKKKEMGTEQNINQEDNRLPTCWSHSVE